MASAPFSASAGNIMVSAKLDSAKMLMGNVNTLRLEVVQDRNVRGHFPLLQSIGERGYATMLNDTIEVGSTLKIDTTEVGSGRIQINYQVPVQVFDSGMYKLPEIAFVDGRDTAWTKPLMLSVEPVKVKADDEISPLTPPADPENPSIFDKLPDWLYYWWWVILLALALIAGGIWAWKKFRKEGTILPAKPQQPPHVIALERLRRLKNRNLWQTGQEKEFYTLLTEILRSYLDARFGIRAMEMTSREIMEKLAEDPSMRENRGRMRQILDMADFVKFAMVRPLPDDNVKAFDNAVAFVESTAPVQQQPDEAATKQNESNSDENLPKHKSVAEKHHLKVSVKARNRRKGGES